LQQEKLIYMRIDMVLVHVYDPKITKNLNIKKTITKKKWYSLANYNINDKAYKLAFAFY
jgi:hypothetical protein